MTAIVKEIRLKNQIKRLDSPLTFVINSRSVMLSEGEFVGMATGLHFEKAARPR